jgi:hypothetical protein
MGGFSMSKKKERKTKKKPNIIFEYGKSPEYREHYVTGARGGVQNGYHIHLEFYREKRRFSTVQHLLTDDSEIESKIVDVETPDVPVVEREFVVGIDLSFHAARELTSFLVKRMKDIDDVEVQLVEAQKKKGEDETT